MPKNKTWPKKKESPTSTSPKTTGGKRMKSNKSGDSAWAKASKKAKSMGMNLGDIVKHRNKYAKGSQEYNLAQNQINEFYGVKKKHKVAGVSRDKDVRLAEAKKGLHQKLPKTTAMLGKLGDILGTKKRKKGTNIAGGM